MKKDMFQIKFTAMLFLMGFSGFSMAQELEEIVVTATKRVANLQDVPVAVSAISQVELNKRGMIETSDLMGSMPNFQVTSAYGTTQPNFSLRGVSVANEFSAATASPVGVYVDEVYQSFRASHGQQLYDLERVEVVRGPQGTLFGRNTTGGTVSFYTKRPALEGNRGYLGAGAGNFGSIKVHGAGEITLIPETFGVRIAGTYNKNDGYTENLFDDKDYAQTDSKAARLSARWRVTDDFSADVKIYYSKNSPRQDIAYGVGYLQGKSDALGYSRLAKNLGEDQIESDTAGEYFTNSNGISLTLNWDVTDDIAITSVTGFDKGKYRLSPFDCDGSPNDMCAIRYLSESDNINQDLRINWDTDRFRFVGGLYYGEDTIDTRNQPDFFGLLRPLLQGAGLPGNFSNIPLATRDALSTIPTFATDPGNIDPTAPANCAPVVINPNGFFDATSLLAFQTDTAINNQTGLAGGPVQTACGQTTPFAPVRANQFFSLERPSFAVYGEAEIPIFDRFELTLGLRWTKDKVKFKDAQTTLFGLDGATPVATTVPYSFPFDPAIGAISQSESDSNLSGRIILNYLINDDMRTYFSFSRGYRAGTYNALAYQGVEQIYYLEPEEVDAFELGFKSRLLDDSVQLNIAAFFYNYTNQQIAQIIGVTSFLRNADGELYGAEAELVAQINDRIRIDGSIGILESEYKDNEFDPNDPKSLTRDINGNPFPNAPDITATIGADINIWRGDSASMDLRLDAQYMGEYFFDPFEDYEQSPCDQPAAGSTILQATPELACGNPDYWLFNARLTYQMEKFSISAWVKNLTDKFYYLYGLNLNAFNLDYLSRGAPRSYGIDFRYNF